MTMIKAVIFGSIGTVTETSEWQREAFNAAFADQGLDWTWDAETYRAMISGDRMTVGGDTRIGAYAESRGTPLDPATIRAIHDAKTQLFQDRMERDTLPLNPGVDALLSDARNRGLRAVFASTTARTSIDTMLRATEPSLAGRFDLVLSGEDAVRPKPAPDIYLAVLEQLHLSAGEVIAIEDSAPSLAAALAAGIATYVVPGQLWRGALFDGASRVLSSLEGIDLEDLSRPLGRDIPDRTALHS
jgi:HAD superfamily hydrolase (TIGR01509 family)